MENLVYIFHDLYAYEIHTYTRMRNQCIGVCIYALFKNETILYVFLQLALFTQGYIMDVLPLQTHPALSDRLEGSPDVRVSSLVHGNIWWETAVDKALDHGETPAPSAPAARLDLPHHCLDGGQLSFLHFPLSERMFELHPSCTELPVILYVYSFS